jgi:hypothetical protein
VEQAATAYSWGDHSTNNYVVEVSDGIWYVPSDGDIETYASNAASGDTLILASADYTITDDIDITKALTIRGQKGGTRIVTATDSINAFHVTASGVTIQDVDIDITASGGTGILFDGTAGAVLTDCHVLNCDIVRNSHAGAQYAIYYSDANGSIRDCMLSVTSTDEYAAGIYGVNAATAEVVGEVDIYDSDITVVSGGAQTGRGVLCFDSSLSQQITMNIYGGTITASGGAGSFALEAIGNNAILSAYGVLLNGDGYDVQQSVSAALTLTDCTVVNGTTNGTILYGLTVVADMMLAPSGFFGTSTGLTGLATHPDLTQTVAQAAGAVQRSGDTMTDVLATTVDQLANPPEAKHFITREMAESLAMSGPEYYFDSVITNFVGAKTTNIVSLSATPVVTAFTNTIASPVPTNTYLMGGVPMQLFGALRSPVTGEIWSQRVGGNVTSHAYGHMEIYYVFDGTTNHLGDWDADDKDLAASTTAYKTMWQVHFPEPDLGGSNIWLLAYVKSTTVEGTACSVELLGGGIYNSHLDLDTVNAGETAGAVAADLAAHLVDPTDSHDASAISATGTYANVQEAIDALPTTYYAARADLGTTNALTWTPTTWSAKWAPAVDATFAMATATTYPRGTFALWHYPSGASKGITFNAQITVNNTITPTGTNLWIISPGDTVTNWMAVGRAF